MGTPTLSMSKALYREPNSRRFTSTALRYLQLARQNCGVVEYLTILPNFGYFPDSHNRSRPNVHTARKAYPLSAR